MIRTSKMCAHFFFCISKMFHFSRTTTVNGSCIRKKSIWRPRNVWQENSRHVFYWCGSGYGIFKVYLIHLMRSLVSKAVLASLVLSSTDKILLKMIDITFWSLGSTTQKYYMTFKIGVFIIVTTPHPCMKKSK